MPKGVKRIPTRKRNPACLICARPIKAEWAYQLRLLQYAKTGHAFRETYQWQYPNGQLPESDWMHTYCLTEPMRKLAWRIAREQRR